MKGNLQQTEDPNGNEGKGVRENLPSSSLLICSRNRPQLLFDTIQSILRGHEVPAEIIIVDQSDVPNLVLSNLVTEQACRIRYLWREKKGVSLGRNTAIEAASHSILVLTDDDMLATPTWFGALVRALQAAGPKVVITGRVLISAEGVAEGFAPSTREDERTVSYQGRVNRDVLFTNNMAIFKSALQRVGGFDLRLGPGTPFPAAEDNDFAFRLLEAGYRIIYDPSAVIYHRAWRSEDEYLRVHWNYGRGQGAFYAKYFSLMDPYMIRRMVRDIFAYLLRFPLRIFRDRNQAYRDILFVFGMLYGATQWRFTAWSRKP